MRKTFFFLLLSMLFTAEAANIPFTRTVSYAAKPGERTRRLDKTLMFAQWEPYSPLLNYLHRYTDRPLFQDVTLRDDLETNPYAGYFRDLEILHNAGIDGFGSLDYFSRHLTQLKLLDKFPSPPGYSQTIVFPGYWKTNGYAKVKHMLIEAAKSPYTTRIDGKLLMTCWGGGAPAHEAWARRLRADKDIPPFLFVGDMPFLDIYTAFSKYELGEHPQPIPQEIVEAARKKVEKAAEAMDGFLLWCTEHYVDPYDEYPRQTLKTDIYRKYLLPIAKEVMGRPENKGKMFGTYVGQGYVNPFFAVTNGEYGTQALRSYLNEILLINPEILMLFEWNEANENTHFQPTVAHGRTWERVLAYYRSLLDRTPPTPRPGDDITVPNLILSVRQALKLGEPYHLELLYLPDGTAEKEVVTRVRLKDDAGHVLVTFPVERILTDEMLVIDYRIPSERFASFNAISVELETEYAGQKKIWNGFDTTRLRTTTCRDYLYSHHPLREVLEPETYQFEIDRADETDTYTITASFSCNEKLASFEVIDDLEEITATDSKNIFDRSKYAILRGRFNALIPSRIGTGAAVVRRGTVTIPGAPNAILKSAFYPWRSFKILDEKNGTWKITHHFEGKGAFFVLVPKTELADAKIVFNFDGIPPIECALNEPYQIGKKGLELKDTIRLNIERVDDLCDYPAPLNAKEAKINVTLPSANRFPAYQLRAVTESGKVWRSPLIHPKAHSPETTLLHIYSDTEKKPVNVSVAKDRIPDLVYTFDPKYDAWLPCAWEGRYDAELGGAGIYAEPMHGAAKKNRLPPDFVRPDPEWVEEDGQPALKFSKGSYLSLPQETIPRGAVYSFSFEVKPESIENQVFLRTRTTNDRDCGLQIVLVDGTLRVSHFGSRYMPSRPGDKSAVAHFDTALALQPGEWNTVTVRKDFKTISCTVNGRTAEFEHDRRARYFQGSVFGGNVAPGPGIPEKVAPFTGFLRAIRVKHNF